MKCPNCGKEMKDESYWYHGFHTGPELDYDYPDCHMNQYVCKSCKIKYKASDSQEKYSKGNYLEEFWEIPDFYERATERQRKAVAAINYHLGTDFIPILKKPTWDFIRLNKYRSLLERDKKRKAEAERDDYDDYDWEFCEILYEDTF